MTQHVVVGSPQPVAPPCPKCFSETVALSGMHRCQQCGHTVDQERVSHPMGAFTHVKK